MLVVFNLNVKSQDGINFVFENGTALTCTYIFCFIILPMKTFELRRDYNTLYYYYMIQKMVARNIILYRLYHHNS